MITRQICQRCRAVILNSPPARLCLTCKEVVDASWAWLPSEDHGSLSSIEIRQWWLTGL
jgi:hypothetical protein